MKKQADKKPIVTDKTPDQMGVLREFVTQQAMRSIVFAEDYMNILIKRPEDPDYDETFKKDVSYLYYRLYEIRKRLIVRYFKKEVRKFKTYKPSIIDREYNSRNKQSFELHLKKNPSYIHSLMIPQDILDACLEIALKFKKTMQSKNKKKLLITFKVNEFYFMGTKLKLDKGSIYYQLFHDLYFLLPNGGTIEMKKFKELPFLKKASKGMDQTKFHSYLKNNLTGKSSGFINTLKHKDFTDEAKKSLFDIDRGGKRITFVNDVRILKNNSFT